ncbi:uncharacterized protein LOC130974662 [Arachis stenosperma]|uniref:uncharacterized protein LOC130974662 n=1 Tax=Arachis stenosperma TaxID=217475 RepID=UPI0025AC1408|nr:uncharacterized protein LOC130974662 [Arachis stenosperma]
MVNEAFNFTLQHGSEDTTAIEHGEDDEDVLPYLYKGPSRATRNFNDLRSDGEQELYPGCSKYSKLSFLVKLYHIKCICGVSDKAMTMILDLLLDAFKQAKLPKTVYEARKTIKKLGIEYTKIDACSNDCMLYQGDDENLTRCKQCGSSRWKQKTKKGSIVRLNVPMKRIGKPIVAKTLRRHPHLPPTYHRYKTSTDILWHKEACNNDGLLRHPRDAEAWKKFDTKYTNFLKDPRNTYFILSTLIPGPKMPGNDIDVYLQPLGHKYKLDWNRFDGQVEGRDPPKKLSGTDVLRQQSNVHDQMLRHNLDVMHVEKNVRDNVVFTILNDSDKSKDNLKARRDLQCMGIRPELWPDEGGKYPSAVFVMSNSQRDVFLKTLQNVIFPDGYSSNVARCVDL